MEEPGREVIVLLPSNRQHELLANPGEGLNRLGVPDALDRLGFRTAFLDVHAKPWNPLAGRPSLFSSIDPLRALDVLTRWRKAFAVVSYYQSGALMILALRKALGFKPLVVIVDIGDDIGWRIRARIVEYCIRHVDAVFTFASEQAAYLCGKYRTGKIHFLPQQVETRFFSPGEGPEGDYVLTVGGDVSRDFETLRQAVYGLGVPVVVRTHLENVGAADYPNVRVITQRQSDAALRELYRTAKIVVLPLKDMIHPGGITTLLEAFACGKAVVVSNSRGVRDYLRDGENCLVVPCGRADALRAAVERLLKDAALRERLGRAARAYAETELSQDRHAERLVTALRRLRERKAG